MPANGMFGNAPQDDFGAPPQATSPLLLKMTIQRPKSTFLHHRPKDACSPDFARAALFGGGGDAPANEMFGNAPQDDFGAPPQSDALLLKMIFNSQVDVSAPPVEGKPAVQPAAALFGGGGDAICK